MTDRWRDEERYRRGSRSDNRRSDYDRYGGYGREESPARERRPSSGYGPEDEYERDWESPGYTASRGYGRQVGSEADYGRRRMGSYGGYAERNRGDDDRSWWERTGDEVRSWFGNEQTERRRREDEHRGRGPRGYTRSDDRIREDVCDRLSDDPRLDASDIEVNVSDGEVTLTGTVSARDAKRRAEDCAEDVSGVKNVQNNLRVQMAETAGTTGASSMTSGSTGAASTTAGAKTRQEM